MEIRRIKEEKENYMELLLASGHREDIILKDMEQAELFVLYEGAFAITAALVVLIKNRQCELKAIATQEEKRNKGYGRYMIHYICEQLSHQCDTIYAGIGDCLECMSFFQKCGFHNSHIAVNYFVEEHEDAIYKDGKRLTDMVYLKKALESEINVKKVVDLALEAGRILLKNGGEIFRVEETIRHICKRFRVENVDIFTLSHGIFVSAENGMEEAYTKVKHVPLSAPHLGIVAEVNELSREISAGNVGIEEAKKRLIEIDQIPFKKGYFQVLAAGLGSGFFGFLLGASPLESVFACVIGWILYLWVLVSKRHNISKILINIIGGVIITTLAISVTYIPFPASVPIRIDGMIIGAIMPLMPGVAFVNAIRDIADSDVLSGTVRIIDALLVFVYIALGVGVTLSVYNNMLGGLS